MSIKITTSKDGNRRVLIQARLNDVSGHADLITMLQELSDSDWSQSDAIATALQVLKDQRDAMQGKGGDIHPLAPTAEFVTNDMLALVNDARLALQRTNEILATIVSGGLSVQDASTLQHEVQGISGKLDVAIVEGAGNYGGQVSMSATDDDFGDWD